MSDQVLQVVRQGSESQRRRLVRHALPYQEARLRDRRTSSTKHVSVSGIEFVVLPAVYDCGGDTSLMIETVTISRHEVFLDVGCGAGAVAVCLAASSAGGVGVDINEMAVLNARVNAERYGVTNVTFHCSDVFTAVSGKFDVIVCNPPYSPHPAADAVDRMFWDPGNRMTRRVFDEIRQVLNPGGRLYFGWCDFPDLHRDLPLRLAEQQGLRCRAVRHKPMHGGQYTYLVYVFEDNGAG